MHQTPRDVQVDAAPLMALMALMALMGQFLGRSGPLRLAHDHRRHRPRPAGARAHVRRTRHTAATLEGCNDMAPHRLAAAAAAGE
jgi:hypothetical protein